MKEAYLKSFDGLDLFYAYGLHPRQRPDRKRAHPALLFVHGMGNNYTAWKAEMDFFYRKGYDVVALDLRGYGRSGKERHERAYRIQNYATDLKTVLDRLKVRRVVLAGHSLGGLIALEFEKLFPKKVQGLVLVDTTYKVTVDAFTGIFRILAFVLVRILSLSFLVPRSLKRMDFSKMRKKSDLYILLKGEQISDEKVDQDIIRNLINVNFKEHLRRIAVPVLIISATKDQIFPFQVAREMQQEIPDAELDVIEATHVSIIKEPETIARLMHEFIGRKIEKETEKKGHQHG
ncbi:alpha/beta hydrolase [Candidatus Woesearchaeota archaeon]|nr:alpha/beta hydrolase [Candidatus Woesearchaeota archaeon]